MTGIVAVAYVVGSVACFVYQVEYGRRRVVPVLVVTALIWPALVVAAVLLVAYLVVETGIERLRP